MKLNETSCGSLGERERGYTRPGDTSDSSSRPHFTVAGVATRVAGRGNGVGVAKKTPFGGDSLIQGRPCEVEREGQGSVRDFVVDIFPFACSVSFYSGLFMDLCHATKGCQTVIMTATGHIGSGSELLSRGPMVVDPQHEADLDIHPSTFFAVSC